MGPVAGRAAFAQELTRFTHDIARGRGQWLAAVRPWQVSYIQVAGVHGVHYTSRMGVALWREAWEANADVLASDFVQLRDFASTVCCAAALRQF